MPDSLGHLRILIAEDDADARQLLTDQLQGLGHEVVAAVPTGRDAVTRAEELNPDVVLLDVHMAGLSGIEAAVALARGPSSMGIVLFSGDADVSLSDSDISATAALAFLPKPAPVRVIDATVRLAASRAREIDAARRAADEARTALENRKIIERAKGILMRRTGTSEQEAYRILQRTSQDKAVPMVEIARAVLESEPGATRVSDPRMQAAKG